MEVPLKLFICFFKDEEAVATGEYAIVIGLILVVVTTFITSFGTRINSTMSNVTNQLPT